MASLFFRDYHFPSELYNRETGDFTTPIRTLLDFTPHILQELPKKEEDQKPIHSDAEDSWTKSFTSSSAGYISSLLNSPKTHAFGEFLLRCGTAYLKSQENPQQEQYNRDYRSYRSNSRAAEEEEEATSFFNRSFKYRESQRDSKKKKEEEEENLKKKKDKKKKDDEDTDKKEKDKQVIQSSATTSTMAKTAAAAGLLSLSLFSTYQASVAFSDVSFHNQLEILMAQVHTIIQSTEIWIQEHDKMEEKVPDQVRTDLSLIRDLVSHLERLDPRSNKKMEAAGWGVGALGGLSALGGIALGSATVLTGGAVLAVGGAVVMISSKAQSAGKGNLGARILLENQAREKIAESKRTIESRKRLIEAGFANKIKEEPKVENVARTSLPSSWQRESQPKESTKQPKERVALYN